MLRPLSSVSLFAFVLGLLALVPAGAARAADEARFTAQEGRQVLVSGDVRLEVDAGGAAFRPAGPTAEGTFRLALEELRSGATAVPLSPGTAERYLDGERR